MTMHALWNWYPRTMPASEWWHSCRAAWLLTVMVLPYPHWRTHTTWDDSQTIDALMAGIEQVSRPFCVATNVMWHIEVTRRRFTVFAYPEYEASVVATRRFNLYLLHLRENVFQDCGFRFKTWNPRKHDGSVVNERGVIERPMFVGVFD